MFGKFKGLGLAPQIRVVVDANIVLSEILSLLKHSANPDYRTRLMELLDAETVIAFSPVEIDREVEEHLPKIARRAGASVETARASWTAYRERIKVVAARPQSSPSATGVRDPKDAPYLWLHESLGTRAILTEDKDLLDHPVAAMRAIEITLDLRDHARHQAFVLNISIGGLTVSNVGIELLRSVFGIARSIGARFMTLADVAQILVVLGALLLFSNPGLRSTLSAAWEWLRPIVGEVSEALDGILAEMIRQQELSTQALNNALKKTPPSRMVKLQQAVLMAFAEAGHPLSEAEIEARVRSLGYVSRARSLVPYIRRALREDARATRHGDRWSLAGFTSRVAPSPA